MANVFSTELSEVKLNSIINPELKEGLLLMLKGMTDANLGRWTTAEGLKKAFDNYEKEERTDDEGNKVKRFATKSKFYEFINVKDANGSQMINAVEFNDIVRINEQSLKDLGFTVGKVYTLASMVGNDDLLTFFDYSVKVMHASNISDLARLSDKGLITMVKSWKESFNPKTEQAETKTEQAETKTEQAETKTEQAETKTETKTEQAEAKARIEAEAEAKVDAPAETDDTIVSIDLADIHVKDIYEVIGVYCEGETETETKARVVDFIKGLKKAYKITTKF